MIDEIRFIIISTWPDISPSLCAATSRLVLREVIRDSSFRTSANAILPLDQHTVEPSRTNLHGAS
jgi:hypothetical protein